MGTSGLCRGWEEVNGALGCVLMGEGERGCGREEFLVTRSLGGVQGHIWTSQDKEQPAPRDTE